jgi:glycine/D-amino acid oxidase-like deaminating enzyme
MFRDFLGKALPDVLDAPVISNRLCMYCDTWDGDFWIDHDPDRPGLIVATGGSGHGFKFAPMLGPIIADVVEGEQNPFANRFKWRARGELRTEDARYS